LYSLNAERLAILNYVDFVSLCGRCSSRSGDLQRVLDRITEKQPIDFVVS